MSEPLIVKRAQSESDDEFAKRVAQELRNIEASSEESDSLEPNK